jgi:hypothetical protein
LAASRQLLSLPVSVFVPPGPIVLGLDDPIERTRLPTTLKLL